MSCKVINPANDKCRDVLEDFGNFIEVDSITYNDRGMGEDYIIIKNGMKRIIKVDGNRDQGGFANFRKGEN
jgi:hypothetical protein